MKTSFHDTPPALLLLALLAGGSAIGIRSGLADYQVRVRKGGAPSAKAFVGHVLGTMEEAMPESLRYPLITFNGAFQRMIGRRTVSNSKDLDVVRLANGHLARQTVWSCREANLQQEADRRAAATTALQASLAEAGIAFLFVLLPHQIDPACPGMLPAGADDCVNPLADAFVARIAPSGVDVLDVRQRLHDQGLSHDRLFFKTDHHLTPEAGLWTYFQIARHLAGACGLAIATNTLAESHYDFRDRRRNWFLGSAGKRTGPAYAGVDDICYLVPRFETSLTYEIPARRFRQSGDFPHAVFSKVHASRDFYRCNSYAAYLNGDHGYSRLINHRGGNGKRLLVLKDSFANVITPHLATAFAETHLVDLRYLVSETLGEVIKRTAPDIVLWMVNVNTLWGPEAFRYDLVATRSRSRKPTQP